LLSCKTGGLLLDMLPTSGQLTVGSGAFVVGLRHRLGLSQAPPGAPAPACECAGRLSRPDHAMTCPLTQSTMTPRHNMLKGAWCRIGRRTGVPTSQEPTLPALRNDAPRHDRDDRGDVLFVMPIVLVVRDVSVTHPAADTYVVAAAREPGAAAGRREEPEVRHIRRGA
jgi:hypothetical protein